jgi:hypothetical protein
MSVGEAIPAVWADIFHFRSVLLVVNASFYKRVARLTRSVFPSVNSLSFFVSMMAKSTSGGSSSSQEAVLLISDV